MADTEDLKKERRISTLSSMPKCEYKDIRTRFNS
jgi:hypothetical protein